MSYFSFTRCFGKNRCFRIFRVFEWGSCTNLKCVRPAVLMFNNMSNVAFNYNSIMFRWCTAMYYWTHFTTGAAHSQQAAHWQRVILPPKEVCWKQTNCSSTEQSLSILIVHKRKPFGYVIFLAWIFFWTYYLDFVLFQDLISREKVLEPTPTTKPQWCSKYNPRREEFTKEKDIVWILRPSLLCWRLPMANLLL